VAMATNSASFPSPKAAGRKRRDPRQMLDAILWILCGGAP
jgi:hypothetical protein